MLLEDILKEITSSANISGISQNFFGIKSAPIKRMKIKGTVKRKRRKKVSKKTKPKEKKEK